MKMQTNVGQASRLSHFSNQPLNRKLAFRQLETGWKPILLGLALSTFNLQFSIAQAQSYSIDWYKVAGGGGTSSGGQYTISGTLGQHDAGGPLTGSNYSLTGGFWAMVSVLQTVGSPTLTVAHSGNGVVVSWPLTAGFVLEQNSDLSTTNWAASSYAVSTNGTIESVTVQSSTGNLFFRLVKP